MVLDPLWPFGYQHPIYVSHGDCKGNEGLVASRTNTGLHCNISLEIIAKIIVYGLFFDRNGFQWRKWAPTSIQRWMDSGSSKKAGSSLKNSHSLSHLNSVHSRTSISEKQHIPFNTSTSLPVTDTAHASIAATEGSPAHAPFFFSYYNRLDGIVVISYWVDLAFMLCGVQQVYLFKAISALRPLRLLSLTEGTSVNILTICSAFKLNSLLQLIILRLDLDYYRLSFHLGSSTLDNSGIYLLFLPYPESDRPSCLSRRISS
jgi:hypothetical protein